MAVILQSVIIEYCSFYEFAVMLNVLGKIRFTLLL